MNAGGRLALYGAGLVMAFGAAFGIAGAVIPDSFVTSWLERSDLDAHGDTHGDEDEQQASGHTLNGLSSTPMASHCHRSRPRKPPARTVS